MKLTSSMITAIAAGIVSLSALSVSIYEAYLMREQQAASVLPIIDYWSSYESGGAYSMNLANKGLGPAYIKDIEISVDTEPKRNWTEVLRMLAAAPVAHAESAMIGSVMAQGEANALISIPDPDAATAIWREAERLSIRVCYCSVFKNCWETVVTNMNTGTPTTSEIDLCPVPGPTLF